MTTPPCPAVVTAAGRGTRFHPFTRFVPKEMLPIGSKPALGHVITECLAAGADHVYVVTRPDDRIVPDYTAWLRDQGLPVRAVPEDLSCGYGNAAPLLTLADEITACEHFLVAFGDDVLLGGTPGADLAAMRALADGTAADAIIAAQRIERSDIGSFGAVDLAEIGGDRVSGIRQRPDPATVAEPLAVVSRLVLRSTILDRLEARPEAAGEVDLGVAVGEQARVGDVRVHRLGACWVTVGEPHRYADALARFERGYLTTSPQAVTAGA